MASSLEYVQHVAAQLSGAGAISYKKLFGEYGLWCGGTFFGTVENNQFYIKVTEAGHKHLAPAKAICVKAIPTKIRETKILKPEPGM